MSNTVIIAGGGPVGLMVAHELGRAGVPSIVLEQRPEHYSDERVGTFHSRLVDVFSERGLFDRLGDNIPRWPMLHFGMMWLDLSSLKDEYNLLVSQTGIERLLEARAGELGSDVRRGHEVIGFTQDDEGVTVRVSGGGTEYELRGSYLVGCDGVDSRVRELAGIEAPPTGLSWYGVIGDLGSFDGDFEAGVLPGGIFGALPEGTGRWRLQTIEFDVPAPADDVPVTIEELAANIERVTGIVREVGEPLWLRRFAGRTRLADSYRAGRVFLAGEAAHTYIPTASHGVNTGLHDAVNLGWKLAAAVQGWAPEGLLDSYHTERHAAGYRACLGAKAQMALFHPLEQVAPLRELWQELTQYEDVNRHLVELVTNIRYPWAPEYDDSLLGTRTRNVALETATGHTDVARLLQAGRGVLLDMSGGALDLGFAAGWADRVDVVAAEPTPELGVSALLIRPDAYVVWLARTGGVEATGLSAALGTWFGAAVSS